MGLYNDYDYDYELITHFVFTIYSPHNSGSLAVEIAGLRMFVYI